MKVRLIVLLLLLGASFAHANGDSLKTKGKSGSEYEPIIGADGKAPEITLRGLPARFLEKMDVEDSPLTKDLSPYGFQIDMNAYLWVAHVSKSAWKDQKAKGRTFVELKCTGVAKQHDPRGFTILHAQCGKQSSWWPF